MKTRIAALLLLALLSALISTDVDARTFWLGREGLGMGKLGAAGSKGSNGTAPGCASTGIFNLSNVCNDIYFIGALK